MTRWINADELKKLFGTECASECAVCKYYNNAHEVDECFCLLVDEATTTNDVKEICVANVTFDKKELEKIVNEQVIEKIKTGELALQDNRKTGKWIQENMFDEEFGVWKCSACSESWATEGVGHPIEANYKFCPNCGADMRGEEND